MLKQGPEFHFEISEVEIARSTVHKYHINKICANTAPALPPTQASHRNRVDERAYGGYQCPNSTSVAPGIAMVIH